MNGGRQMQTLQSLMRKRAKELLEAGEVWQVIAWKKGDFICYPEPAFFTEPVSLDNLTYDRFCSANLSKYMIKASKQTDKGKTLVFFRPCDTYSFNQLLKDNQVKREQAYIIGVGCEGCVAVDEGRELGLLEGCLSCTKTTHQIYDELIGADISKRTTSDKNARFEFVDKLEAMDSGERNLFWREQFAKCMRCNACRNICPVCHCNRCVFDGDKYGTQQKANATLFEGQMFHVIRTYHGAGRCTDCGQCGRVCPQGIPLHLLNRKFIKDINALYGEYQAGEDINAPSPLTHFDIDGDSD